MRDAIYIGTTQQKLKKRMDNIFFDLQNLLKSGENRTRLLPILNNTVDPLCHAQTYVSA